MITDVAALERRLAEQDTLIRETKEQLDHVRTEMARLRAALQEMADKQATTCKKCGLSYDLFAHHYSIGLFDNIVYVKCPGCQTPMPVDPHLGVRKE